MTLGDSSPSRLNGIQAGVRDLDIGDVQGDDVTVAAPPKSTVEDEWKPDEEDKENENGKRDDNGVENESGDAPEVSNQQLGEEAPKKKKKRKKKSKGSRKFPPPTGFEDNFVDGPLTPDLASQESTLYHPSKPFTERIETCIQRYRAKRKFDPVRLQIFTSYLNLGGISTGPKAFSGGLDVKNNDDLDAEQIQKMAATEFVNQNDADLEDGEWEVDFEYVVRGFLSHKVPYVLGYMRFEDLELSAKVIRNFLNYIIYHNVAVEYNSSVRAAITICDLAEKELILCRQVSSRLPGKFNMACSTLFGGYYAGMKDETLTWNAGPAADVGLTNAEAAEIFNVSLEKRGSAFQKELGTRVKLLKAEFLALEVKEIIFAGTSGVKKPLPKAIQDDIDSGVIAGSEKKEAEKTNPGGYDDTGLNALGRLLVKVWVPEGPEDQEIPDTDLDEFEIWLEMEALQYCFVGMHIEAKVHSMSSGLIWIDSVTAVQCSFYLHLDSPDKDTDDEFD